MNAPGHWLTLGALLLAALLWPGVTAAHQPQQVELRPDHHHR